MVSFKMSLNLLTKFRKKKLECYIPTYTNKLLFRILFHTLLSSNLCICGFESLFPFWVSSFNEFFDTISMFLQLQQKLIQKMVSNSVFQQNISFNTEFYKKNKKVVFSWQSELKSQNQTLNLNLENKSKGIRNKQKKSFYQVSFKRVFQQSC